MIGARIIVNLRLFDFFWVKVAITNHVLLNLLLLIMFLLKLIFFFAHPPLPKTFDQSVLLFFLYIKKPFFLIVVDLKLVFFYVNHTDLQNII